LAEPVVVDWMKDTRPGRGFWGPLASHLLTGMPAAIGYMLLAPFVRQRFPSWEARWRARKPSRRAAPQANAAPAKPAEPAVDLVALGYASFGRRALAELVDWTLCFFVIVVPLSVYFSPATAPPGQPDALMSDGDTAAFMFLLLLGLGAYHVLLWSSAWRATLGMKVARIIVTDGAGYRLSPWRATGRFFARWLSYYTAGLGFLIALFSQQNKTLHDRIAGTVVLRRPAKP
jgi:uncharacterized RDD family membrane protein YckC